MPSEVVTGWLRTLGAPKPASLEAVPYARAHASGAATSPSSTGSPANGTLAGRIAESAPRRRFARYLELGDEPVADEPGGLRGGAGIVRVAVAARDRVDHRRVREVHMRGDTEVERSPDVTARGLRRLPASHVHEADDLARDVMTPIALWVPESGSIAEAARVIATGDVHAVIVARDDGVVVGILSAIDIVAWVADG